MGHAGKVAYANVEELHLGRVNRESGDVELLSRCSFVVARYVNSAAYRNAVRPLNAVTAVLPQANFCSKGPATARLASDRPRAQMCFQVKVKVNALDRSPHVTPAC